MDTSPKIAPEEDVAEERLRKGKVGMVDKIHMTVDRVYRFSIMDVIEDDCRVRMLNVWAFLLVYVFFVLAVLRGAAPSSEITLGVKMSTQPPRSLLAATSNPTRTMTAYSTNVDGSPRENVRILPYVLTFSPTGPLACSYPRDTTRLANTLEGERLRDVCSYQVTGGGLTDRMGLSNISGFSIAGPAGVYEVGVEIPSEGFRSQESASTITRTSVSLMEVVRADDPSVSLRPPTFARPGQPFADQPAVRVVDAQGDAQVGVVVLAFSNPDPSWPPTGIQADVPRYDRQGQRHATLNCPQSEPSDSDGIARFTCLGLESSSSDLVNIIFAVDAFIFLPWNDPIYNFASLTALMPTVYKASTVVQTEVRNVAVIQAPPASVEEGTSFQVQVQLTDANNLPVSGRICKALVSSEYENILPMMFRRKVKGFTNKELLFASSQPSDSTGLATFPNLQISPYGNTRYKSLLRSSNSSTLGITFSCDGMLGREVYTTMVSKVAQVTIKRFLSTEAFVSKYKHPEAPDGSDAFIVVVRVVDSHGRGVQGKSVFIEAQENNESDTPIVTAIEDSMEPTSSSGFAVIPFRVIIAASNRIADTGSQYFRVKCVVDGVSSAASIPLKLKLRGPIDPGECHGIMPAYFSFLLPGQTDWNAPGATRYVEPFQERPFVLAGQRLLAVFMFFGTTMDTRVNYGNRTGDIRLQVTSAYSTDGERICLDGECVIQTPHQPQIMTASLDHSGLGSALQTLHANQGAVIQWLVINAPAGTHFMRLQADIDVPPYRTTCYSPPVLIDVANPLVAMKIRDTNDNYVGQTYQTGQPLDLDVFFQPIDEGPSHVFLANSHYNQDQWADGAVSAWFLEAPMTWQNYFDPYASSTAANAPHIYTITEILPFNMTRFPGFGHMRLRITWNMPGLFGDFALLFSSRGIRSNAFRFTLAVPPSLELEVVQEPSAQWMPRIPCRYDVLNGCLTTMNALWTPPQVRVKSNGNAINGVPVFAEPVAHGDAVLQKLTAIPYYDISGILMSTPSGYSTTGDILALDTRPDMEGIAQWLMLGVMDGEGCVQWRFTTGATGSSTTAVYPATPICFVSAPHFQIRTNPPRSLPLGTPLSQISAAGGTGSEYGGAIGLTISFDTLPDLVRYAGMFVARFAVSHFKGRELSKPEVEAYTKALLTNTVCVWAGWTEIFGRCSPLRRVPGSSNSIETEVLQLKWAQVTELPATIKIMVSDLSLTPLFREASAPMIPMPPDLPFLDKANRTAVCLEAMLDSSTGGMGSQTTVEIKPELMPASAEVMIPPPDMVEVGQTFLVRLRVLTASGTPARQGRVAVAITGTSGMSSNSISATDLQDMAAIGDRLAAFRNKGVADLDEATTEQIISSTGSVSFPLTIKSGKSGNYQLKFQVIEPGASVLLTTPSFIVVNPIASIGQPADGAWNEIEVDSFLTPQPIPWQPQFQVTMPDGSTLEELEAMGLPVNVRATLKGANKWLIKAKARLYQQRQQMAGTAGDVASSMTTQVLAGAQATAQSAAQQAMGRIAPDFQAECMRSGMAALQGAVGEFARPLSTAETAMLDPSVLDPSAMMGQFVRSMTGGGSSMTTSSEMTAMLTVTVPFSQLSLVRSETFSNGTFVGVYNITREINFHFQEGGQYAWAFSLSGIQSPDDAFDTFTVIKTQPSFIQQVFDWIVSAIAGIICVLALTTNTRRHHWCWHAVAAIGTIACMVVVPFLKGPVQALNGNWAVLAIINLALVLLCTIWSFVSEMKQCKVMTFGEKKDQFYHVYVRKQLVQALSSHQKDPHPEDLPIMQQFKQMVKPFNTDTAFFYPSQLLVGFCLAMFSFGFLVMKTVELAINIRGGLSGLLNKVTQQGLNLMNAVDLIYFQSMGGAELPDSAINFVTAQMRMVTDWFESLILAFEVGIWTGCALAAITTITVFLLTFWDFRLKVLSARRGKKHWRKKDALAYMDANFMGAFIATTAVGYIVIVLVVTLLLVIIVWDISREIIWSYRGTIFWTLIVPSILNALPNLILKKFFFGQDYLRHRPLATIYMFWQTWLSFLSGIMSAIVRFALAATGVTISLPQVMAACTPAFMNQVICLDTPYKQYIAAVLVYHTHCNPVVHVATQNLLTLQRNRQRRIKEEGLPVDIVKAEAQRRSKRMVILLLMKHPWLRKYRKAQIYADVAQKRAEKEAAKTQKVAVTNSRKPSSDERKLLEAIHRIEVDQLAFQKASESKLKHLRGSLSQIRQMPIGSSEASCVVDAALVASTTPL